MGQYQLRNQSPAFQSKLSQELEFLSRGLNHLREKKRKKAKKRKKRMRNPIKRRKIRRKNHLKKLTTKTKLRLFQLKVRTTPYMLSINLHKDFLERAFAKSSRNSYLNYLTKMRKKCLKQSRRMPRS